MVRVQIFISAVVILVSMSAVAIAQTRQGGWIADSSTGCKVWNDYPKPRETVTWSGACANGLAQGRGAEQWFEDGKPTDRYEGELRDGKLNGRGVYTFANGHRYEGELLDGKPNGFGQYTSSNGAVYEGVWIDGCFRDGDRRAAISRDLSSCQ